MFPTIRCLIEWPRARAGRVLLPAMLSLVSVGCDKHDFVCEKIAETVGLHDGFDAPGVAGAPRWGIPETIPDSRRVRRSWSTLSGDEKRKVLDAFLALKNVTVDSGDPGSSRANYNSLCEATGQTGYKRNLYDFYVEAHMNAFISMGTPHETMMQMSHQAPQFMVWHRYLLLRMEADLAEITGEPDFALPYWDWTDCEKDDDINACNVIFEEEYLGSAGGCDDDKKSVNGYLTDQGFKTNIYTNDESPFSPESVVCGQRPIKRAVGCTDYVEGAPSTEDIQAMFSRPAYDAAPYESCETDEAVSFRQYLEGFSKDSEKDLCVAAGCGMHGRAHFFVGGDMDGSTASPNDPIFFLNHAEVDRLWAAWQEANLASGDAERMANVGNPGYPDHYLVPLFNFPDVTANDMFDYKALGYEYDTLPAP